MSEQPDKTGTNILEAMQRQRARLLEEAAAVERDMAEIARLAAKYNLSVDSLPLPASAPPERAASAGPSPSFQDLALRDLIFSYRVRNDSPYQRLTFKSRGHYDSLLKLIESDYGTERLSAITDQTLQGMYEAWKVGGKLAIAHGKMGMLRGLFGFGTEVLRDDHCARLSGLLARMKFEAPKARTEHLSREQAVMIRAKAREKERASIALAQAFQSDVGLLQKDVIGEWVPVSEPGVSDVTFTDDEGHNEKWLRGIRWNEIDKDLVLRHPSERQEIQFDLKRAPMVLDELKLQYGFDLERHAREALPASGPIILSEWSGIPWTGVEFRRWWRKLADECGISKNVRNSDSRIKAHTEKHESARTKNMSGSTSE